MTGEQEARGGAHAYSDEELAYIGEHMDEFRPWATGPRFLYWSLAIGFSVGLAAHVTGYLLGSSATSEPFGLAVDLLSAFGGALWTGVVVVLFAQVIPNAKRRQMAQAVAAYQAWRRKQSGRGRGRPSDDGPSGSQRPG